MQRARTVIWPITVLASTGVLCACTNDRASGSNAPAYLYRSSLIEGQAVYVAAFDSKDSAPGNNLGNCQDVADLEAKGPGKGLRWWCEAERNRKADGG